MKDFDLKQAHKLTYFLNVCMLIYHPFSEKKMHEKQILGSKKTVAKKFTYISVKFSLAWNS